eukprot:752422-Hanusia_phi.AAC.8
MLATTYLQKSAPVAQSSDLLDFSSLNVYDTVAKSSILSITFVAGSTAINVTTSTFKCWPYSFSVYQYKDSTKKYLSTSAFTTDQTANLGDYSLALLDANGKSINLVYSIDAFSAQFSLLTGASFDSSTPPTLSSNSVLSSSDLIITNIVSNTVSPDGTVTLSNSSTAINILVANQVGLYFLLLVNVASAYNPTILFGAAPSQTSFSINAGSINISYGLSKEILPISDPKVVLLDAVGSSDTSSSFGLPLPLYVQFETSDYQILAHANCLNCVQARLVKCSNSVPSQYFFDQECTTFNQAQCATSNQNGTKCSSAGYSSTSFLETLGGTTVVHLENGTAIFTDLTVQFVAGSGYKLQFTLNAGGRYTQNDVVQSSQTKNGQTFVPSVGSFFVRPYSLNVVQEVGGDGVDINGDNVPDGVGVDIPFRVQPAVAIAGNGYSFNKNWGQHGWIPISSQIVSSSCGGDCSQYNMTLYGSSTGASTYASEYLMWSSYSGFIGSPNQNVHLAYDLRIGNVGLVWQDLTIKTANQKGVLNVLLSFACGPRANISSISTVSTMLTYFDLFSAPSTPSNLKISDYGQLGFRIEFDPGLISREAPLSGFLVEFDICQQEKDVSCSTVENSFYAGLGFSTPVSSILGSGLDLGGGYTQEAYISIDSKSAGNNVTISAVNVTMEIQRTIYPGDNLIFNFASLQSTLLASFDQNCTLQGANAQNFKILSYNATTSVIVMSVQDGSYLVWGSIIQFQFPYTCLISGYSSPPFGQTVLQVPVIGVNSQVQFDNCKGNSTCLAAKTGMLPSIQDENSMDLDWNGQLQYGSTGAPCATNLTSTSNLKFPSNRLCSTADSGSNGFPIGYSFASNAKTSGSLFIDSNAACRSNQAQSNPCALSVGQSWTFGIQVMYSWNGYVTNQSMWQEPQVELWFASENGISVGDIIRFTIPNLVQQQPSSAGTCFSFHEVGSQQIGYNTISQSANFPNSSFYSECEIFTTVVTLNYGSISQKNWETHFDNTAGTFQIFVGSLVLPGTLTNIKINGFHSTQGMNLNQNAIGEVIRGKRTTLVFSQDSIKASYSAVSGNPISGYTETRQQEINLGDIVSFRVYAYNGRFRSAPIQSFVQNRAIQPPLAPAYFPNIQQIIVTVNLTVSNLASAQSSGPYPGYAPPVIPVAGEATRIGLQITPEFDVFENHSISINLPGFVGQDYFEIPLSYVMMEEYAPSGTPGCACDSNGGIITPRNLYTLVAEASGPEACNWTDMNSSRPACACGECSCALDGTLYVPSDVYNASGNCTKCACKGATPQIVTRNPTYPNESCTCSCVLQRKCSCSCPVSKSFTCSCLQNYTSSLFQRVLWSQYSESFVLTVGEGIILRKGVQYTVWISKDAGILFPLGGISSYPQNAKGDIILEGYVNSYQLRWLTPFPGVNNPRLGYVIQMTTDHYWRSDIQTVVVREGLSRGLLDKVPVAYLLQDISASDTVFTISTSYELYINSQIMIENEIMQVISSNSTYVDVIRGVRSTMPVPHLSASSPGCTCLRNGSAIGATNCKCTEIYLVRIGVTDVATGNDGLDFKAGTADCHLAELQSSWPCNPTKYAFPYNARTHQATIIKQVDKNVQFVGACGASTATCTSNCICNKPSLVSGAEFMNPQVLGNISIASTGDPLTYPTQARSSLVLSLTSDSDVLALSSLQKIVGDFIRVDNEIMFVKYRSSQGRGIIAVNLFKSIGGRACSCSFNGTVSGPSYCSCSGNAGENCTSGGTLEATGLGSGFAATFTVANGQVSAITVTNPGVDYGSDPTVFIASGGDGCVNYNLYAVTSIYVLKVTRGSLYSTPSVHAAGSEVGLVLWPSQVVRNQVGFRYNFRIAAFNAAGFSDWIYFDMRLFAVSSRVLAASGNQRIQISLIGGGVTWYNPGYQVWIGKASQDGLTVDLQNSKECKSVLILDDAGTKLKCTTPSGVGSGLDLIVLYRNGAFSQIAVGSRWMRYQPPNVNSILPALVAPGRVTVTVYGANFGLSSSAVSGVLKVSTEVPCNPLVVKSDSQLLCTLNLPSSFSSTGSLIITAGGQSSQPTKTSTIAPLPAPVAVSATIQADYQQITSNPVLEIQFKINFVNDVSSALKVPASRLNVTQLQSGSVIVSFDILPDLRSAQSSSPAALALELSAQASDPNSALRQGNLTSNAVFTVPSGLQQLVNTSNNTNSIPTYFSSCLLRSYQYWDMEMCFDCCSYACEVGPEIPVVNGWQVLPGFRAEVCQSLCLDHCGYARPIPV